MTRWRVIVFTGLLILSMPVSGVSASSAAVLGDTVEQQELQPSAAVDVELSDLPGSGTSADPYVITNASELEAMEDDVHADYVLGGDIDASHTAQWNNGSGFKPVWGRIAGPYTDPLFNGTFDGAGHTITGLTISRPERGSIGLFGKTGRSATISNVTLTNASVTGSYAVGVLVGENKGARIHNVSASGRVSGSDNVGGLVGIHSGRIRNAAASVRGTGSDRVGGLVGDNSGRIHNASASGRVTGSNSVGGLVGGNSGRIRSVSASGRVNGTERTGGLAGWNDGTIHNASASGRITGSSRTGGLVGHNAGMIRTVSASARVNGTEGTGGLVGWNVGVIHNASASGRTIGSDRVGGHVGWNVGPIRNASASGRVTGSDRVGGFAGFNEGLIQDVFAVGSTTVQTGGEVGGLVGSHASGSIRDAYWDVDATGQSSSDGPATGLTTTQMTGEAARTNMAGLPFGTVWQIRPNTYPTLALQTSDSQNDTARLTPTVVGDNPAQDLNGDGTYEDVNGDGTFDIVDVNALFQHRQEQAVQDNAMKFDFNGDGTFDVVDIRRLFQNT